MFKIDYHVCLDYGIYMSSSKSVQSLENCSLHFVADPDDQNYYAIVDW